MIENKERLQSYVRRQIELCDELLGSKIKVGGKTLKTRNIYIKICEYIKSFKGGKSDRRWIIIPGLRGTGKTTVLAQSYFFIKNNYKNANAIYFSVDDAIVNGFDIMDIIDTYMEEIGQRIESAKDVFIMLDEVQSNYDWAKILKTYHDKSPGVFLICSGSSAVNLQSNADVAGRRAEIECLYPMSFCEYEFVEHDIYPIKGLKDKINDAFYFSKDAEECYLKLKACEQEVSQYCQNIKPSHWTRYIKTGSLPFTLPTSDEGGVYKQVLQTVEKIVYKDLPQIDNIDAKSIPIAMSLLQLLSEADSISVNKVAGLLGVSPITLTSILDSFCKAELLIKIKPYGSNFSAARKNSKYLFASSTIRAALYYRNGSPASEKVRDGRILEDVAGLHFYRRSNINHAGDLFYDSAQGGADFIVRTGDTAVVFETGRGKKDSTQVESTLERIGERGRYGITICDTNKIVLSNSKKNVFIPWRVFALAG